MAGDDPDCQNVSFVRNYWSDNHSHCSLRSVPGRRRGVWERNHGLHSCVRCPRLPSRQNVVSPRFCLRQNTSGCSKSLRAGARDLLDLNVDEVPSRPENPPVISIFQPNLPLQGATPGPRLQPVQRFPRRPSLPQSKVKKLWWSLTCWSAAHPLLCGGGCLQQWPNIIQFSFSQDEPKDGSNNFLLLDPIPTLPTGPTSKGNLVILWFLRWQFLYRRLVRSAP